MINRCRFVGLGLVTLLTATGLLATEESSSSITTNTPSSVVLTVTDFEARIDSSITPTIAQERFGKPDRVTGTGLTIYVYELADQSEIWFGFPGDVH
jgi:hypothetical protein